MVVLISPVLIFKNIQSRYFSEMTHRMESYLDMELTAARVYRESQEETSAFRHDIKNNLLLLSGLMKQKRFDDAEAYLDELHGRVSSLSMRFATGDEMLDSLLASKYSDISSKGIALSVKGVIDGGLGWRPADVCAVFANLIDNAAEACEKIDDPADRYIRIAVKQTDYQRIIVISNSTAHSVDCKKLMSGAHYTSKSDRQNHGYGIRSIQRALDVNSAILDMECTDSEFKATILAPKNAAVKM